METNSRQSVQVNCVQEETRIITVFDLSTWYSVGLL
jgi:hypothetical protein